MSNLKECRYHPSNKRWECLLNNRWVPCAAEHLYQEMSCDNYGNCLPKQKLKCDRKRYEMNVDSLKLEHYLDTKVTNWQDLLEMGRKIVSGNFSSSGTGMEEQSLTSGWANKQLLSLNWFVFTTGSTNSPEDPTFQPMWLDFMLPMNMATKLVPKLQNSPYSYLVSEIIHRTGDNVMCYTVDKRVLPGSELIPELIEETHQKRSGCDEIPPSELLYISQKNPNIGNLIRGPNKLVAVTVEDPVQERRTLYKGILKIVQNL